MILTEDVRLLSQLERSKKILLEENAYLRKRLETLKMDVDRAEMRMAKSEQARIEADQRYNEMVDKYR